MQAEIDFTLVSFRVHACFQKVGSSKSQDFFRAAFFGVSGLPTSSRRSRYTRSRIDSKLFQRVRVYNYRREPLEHEKVARLTGQNENKSNLRVYLMAISQHVIETADSRPHSPFYGMHGYAWQRISEY